MNSSQQWFSGEGFSNYNGGPWFEPWSTFFGVFMQINGNFGMWSAKVGRHLQYKNPFEEGNVELCIHKNCVSFFLSVLPRHDMLTLCNTLPCVLTIPTITDCLRISSRYVVVVMFINNFIIMTYLSSV